MRSDFVRKEKEKQIGCRKVSCCTDRCLVGVLRKKFVLVENRKGGPKIDVYRTRDKNKVSKSKMPRLHNGLKWYNAPVAGIRRLGFCGYIFWGYKKVLKHNHGRDILSSYRLSNVISILWSDKPYHQRVLTVNKTALVFFLNITFFNNFVCLFAGLQFRSF